MLAGRLLLGLGSENRALNEVCEGRLAGCDAVSWGGWDDMTMLEWAYVSGSGLDEVKRLPVIVLLAFGKT
jgi:hypothetical protein